MKNPCSLAECPDQHSGTEQVISWWKYKKNFKLYEKAVIINKKNARNTYIAVRKHNQEPFF